MTPPAMTPPAPPRALPLSFAALAAAMAVVVTASNILVQHPIRTLGLGDYLTYGALTYPFAFLVTDLANRHLGPSGARRVALVGFACAVALSAWLATPRIAIASGAAFLCAQLLDIAIFHRLRGHVWWVAPLASTVAASALDTALFFGLAFHCSALPLIGGTVEGWLGLVGVPGACEPMPWVTLALADYAVKLAMALAALAPYVALAGRGKPLSPA
jgi:hypothetical protein